MLSAPLCVSILRALAEGGKQQVELRNETGLPAQSTLRAQLKRLESARAITRHRRNRFPGVLEYDLTPAGEDLLPVIDVLEAWLDDAPEGPLQLESQAARAATKALAEAWSTRMLRALAVGPRSLTELDRLIGSLSYPSLERRLSALRLAEQVKAEPSGGRRTPYALTTWARMGIAPLAAAARWERDHARNGRAPVGHVDAETLLLLPAPLLDPPAATSGVCRLAVELPRDDGQRLVGVTICVTAGEITSYSSRLDGAGDAWALGSLGAWLDAIVRANLNGIELGGNASLARDLIRSVHNALFRTRGSLTP
jgi:DNA-binding HxlR family transcriptional regulator